MARRILRTDNKMRRGYVIAWDALIALTFVIFLTLGFIGIQYTDRLTRGGSTFESLNSRSENAIDTLNKRGVLEEIGYFWASGNLSYAANLTKDNLDSLIPKTMGYRLEAIDGSNVSVIYDSGDGRVRSADARDQTRSVRLISGYKENASRSGWAARASLIENESWGGNRVSNTSICCASWDNLLVRYSPAATTMYDNVFYILVPGGASMAAASFNITWVGEEISISSSASESSSSASSSSSSESIPQSECNECPATPSCDIPGTFSAFGDSYNYHSIDIPQLPPSGTCNLRVTIYTGIAGTPVGTNMYDIYVNEQDGCSPTCDVRDGTCGCQCQRPWSRPDLNPPWGWDDTTFFDPYPLNNNKYYRRLDLLGIGSDAAPMTYQVMVDCWSPEGGGNLCPGSYYIYLTSLAGSDPACPTNSPPSFSSESTAASSASATASAGTSAGASSSPSSASGSSSLTGLGEACAGSGECESGHCGADYDGSGQWCAPAGNCTHSDIATCDGACYGYGSGDIAPNCNSTTALWNCTSGTWSNVSCPVCGDGLGVNLPCKGLMTCADGTPAQCSGGCTTENADCDYCGSFIRGNAGSDTWYNSRCNATGGCECVGGCGIAKSDCAVCKSCNVTAYSGSCEFIGVNPYVLTQNDTVDTFKCGAGQYCDGAGACMVAPITACDPTPTHIYFDSGVCGNPDNCDDDGSDGSAVRLSFRNHIPGDTYTGGWAMFDHAWQKTYPDDDDMSIGETYEYTKHGSTFDYNVSVGSGNSISFLFSAMPEGDCKMNIILKNMSDVEVGQCTVGNDQGVGNCMPFGGGSLSLSRDSVWRQCTINGNTAITDGIIHKNAVNTLRVEYSTPFSGSCGADMPCVLFLDTLQVTCS